MYKRMCKLLFILAGMFCLALLTACSGPAAGKNDAVGFDVIREPGYYQEVIMQPNGEFLARYKVDDAQAASAGHVRRRCDQYTVERYAGPRFFLCCGYNGVSGRLYKV